MMTRLKRTLSEIERKYVVDRLWTMYGQVEKGRSTYWTAQQLRHLAFELEPFGAEYEDDRPVNVEKA